MGRSERYNGENDRDLNWRKGLKKNKNRIKRKRKRNTLNDFKKMDPGDINNIYTYYEEELEGDW